MSFLLSALVLFMAVAWMGQRFHVQGYNTLTPVQKRWWMDSASALEPFTNLDGSIKMDKKEDIDEVADHSPGKPAPVDLLHMDPYLLLSDTLGKTEHDGVLSSITSRSCYGVDTEAYLSRVGNFRQLTNNYKREYPDSCSAPRQELVLNFYEPKPVIAPVKG